MKMSKSDSNITDDISRATRIDRVLLLGITNRTRVSIALEILEHVVPDSRLIMPKEFEEVVRLLATWEMRYLADNSIKIVDIEDSDDDGKDERAEANDG